MSASSLRELSSPVWDDKEEDTTFIVQQNKSSFFVDRRGLCSHAVAHGTTVLGGIDITQYHQHQQGKWWTWKTQLQHTIESITSNADGSIVVAATDAGTVSLLRGCDGQIVATRQVVEDGGGNASASLSWILGNSSNNSNNNDCLLLEVSTSEKTNLMLVSNLDGKRLNLSDDPAQVAEAARLIQLQTMPLEQDLRALSGYFVKNSVIRFVACDYEGHLVVLDYAVDTKTFSTIKEATPLRGDDETEWVAHHDLGFCTVEQNSDQFYFICGASSADHHQSMIVWFDPNGLQPACQFLLQELCEENTKQQQRRSKLLAYTPVQSCDNNSLALVVAEKVTVSTSGNQTTATTNISVVQVLVEETMGLCILSKPHVLYTIPMDEPTILLVTLAPLSTTEPYAFYYKVWENTDVCSYKSFCPDISTSQAVGRFRQLLAREDLDHAEDVLEDDVIVDNLIKDPFANFYPSEVALKRFQVWLRQGDMSSADHASEYIRQLASGAVSGNQKALLVLFEAIRSVVNSTSSNQRSLPDMIFGLSAFAACLGDVEKALSNEHGKKLASKRKALEQQLAAWKAVASMGEQLNAFLQTPLHSIRSPAHLFSVLIEESSFEQAEMFCRSGGIFQLSTEEMVSPFLKLSSKVQPDLYIWLLRDLILPRLFANEQSLSQLRAWSCRTADALDDADKLEDAILLLETMDTGTKDSCIRMHSSFAFFSPFVATSKIGRGHSPRSFSQGTSSVVDRSCATNFGEAVKEDDDRLDNPSANQPVQTILELGALKGGAAKLRSKMLGAFNEDDAAYEGVEDCVESKLQAAGCLKRSRALGLPRDLIKLRTFDVDGGSQRIAKELTIILSSAAADHEARNVNFNEHLKPFCNEFAVSYDEALLSCTKELCRSQDVSPGSIDESASIARCCVSFVSKCKATLYVLRASLLCGYAPDLVVNLSRDAIIWASCDSALQSEVEEATRLLSIDRIVLKYCGSKAKELFRVDNPRHAVRLLNFVTGHSRNKSVVSDTIALCDAFHHVSQEEAASAILYNSLSNEKPGRSVELFEELFARDPKLAQVALLRTIASAEDLLDLYSREIESACSTEISSFLRGKALSVTDHAVEMLTCALGYVKTIEVETSHELHCFLTDASLATLRSDFLRILRLQRDHGVYASLSRLSSPTFVLDGCHRLLRDAVTNSLTDDASTLRTNLTATKRACSLLSGDSKFAEGSVWSTAAAKVIASILPCSENEKVFDLLADLSLLEPTGTGRSTFAQIDVAMSCCHDAAKKAESSPATGMYRMAIAATLLNDWSLRFCPENLISNVSKFAGNLDVVCHTLARADEGMGEQLEHQRMQLQRNAFENRKDCQLAASSNDIAVSLSYPKLYSWWYVGDGLLLPPRQALAQSIAFSQWLTASHLGQQSSAQNLFDFIYGRGAHSLATRVLSMWSTAVLTGSSVEDASIDGLEIRFDDVRLASAERSLGGTGTGITNAVVDSQLSLSFLLALPMKQAFKTYRACIPTAVKTRDFERLLSLANIGLAGASGESGVKIGVAVPSKWAGQQKFFEQCKQISCRAMWSIVLDHHNVSFDPSRFDRENGAAYVSSLLSSVISAFAKTLGSSDVIALAAAFARTFGVSRELVIEKHIEQILSPHFDAGKTRDGSWPSLVECEKVSKASLRLLKSPVKRSAVLRRCLVRLEQDASFFKDYERYALVLGLYQEALICLVDGELVLQGVEVAPYEYELELVDRRRDALTILSSFFQGEREKMRPSFPSFFLPLQTPLPQGPPAKVLRCGVLGRQGEECFDPISALEKTFMSFPDTATASSLAPLCHPLGLPSGYIHARSLVVRFKAADTCKSAFPSFENDVIPVCERLRSSSDKRSLAEWCAGEYVGRDQEKLDCLDLALKFALATSTEIEARLQQDAKNAELMLMEKDALDIVKRISTVKEALSDRLRVKSILRSTALSYQSCIDQVTKDLIRVLDEDPEELSPERMIHFLLEEGSLIAAKSCLDKKSAFSMQQLRQFCSVVHGACDAIAEQHSHIHPHQTATRYARKWLLHGDESQGEESTPGDRFSLVPVSEGAGDSDNCDDTIDFVMDLTDLQSDDGWNASSVGRSNAPSRQLTSDEEPSSVKETSPREVSENACKRASLRIAFALAFPQPLSEDGSTEKENAMERRNQTRPAPRSRKGLLSKIDTKRDSRQEDRIFGLCKELLGIVFAGSGYSSSSLFKLDASFDTMDGESAETRTVPKTITFAMRHRALRAVSVLCPQEALQKVLYSDSLTSMTLPGKSIDLKQCAFGAFIAKEIEEMGLPLPHADLARLSSMHFLSYARTLWRHHWGNDNKYSKGRLILLLLEMSLKTRETDADFVAMLLKETIRLKLPRTLLLSLECLRDFSVRLGNTELLTKLAIQEALDTLGACIASEVKVHEESSSNQGVASDIELTLVRVHQSVIGFSLCGRAKTYQDYLVAFIEKLSKDTQNSALLSGTLTDVLFQTQRLNR